MRTTKTSFKLRQTFRSPLLLTCAAWLAAGAAGVGQTRASISTTDLRLDVVAGPTSPSIEAMYRRGALTIRNLRPDTLPQQVEIAGKMVPLRWRLLPGAGRVDTRHVTFVYEAIGAPLRLYWTWETRASFGPVEHRIRVENLGTGAVWLPLVDSLRLSLRVAPGSTLRNFYVEKGAGGPSSVGTHLDKIADGYNWTGESSTYAHPADGEPREIVPATFVFAASPPQTGWFAGIEFSGRTRIHIARHGEVVTTTLGLNPRPGPYRTRVSAGESFQTPTVFLGSFRNGPDGAANQIRPWVRTVLGNPQTWLDPMYPPLVSNSWGSGMEVNEALALRMIADAKALGLEMFHLDAGWFRGVADWMPDPRKFPNGLAPVADAAHRSGLRFGIWSDWTQAGVSTLPGALNVHDQEVRNWMVSDLPPDWKPEEFKGQTIDIGVPAAHDYAQREVERMVNDFHLDMLEHDGYLVAQGCTRTDHPHAPPDAGTINIQRTGSSIFVSASNSTDVSDHAVRAYYDIYQQARQQHPHLLLEICNDGGRMVDFGSAAHGDYFSISDAYDPISNRRAFYDTSYVLPAAMLETYVEKWPAPHIDNFLYMLRSGMMGWLTIMLDTTSWTDEQHAAAKSAIDLYKRRLRPLIRDAALFHIAARPDGVHWDGMEYWDASTRKGVVYAFRGSVPDQPEHWYPLAGLKPERRYRLEFVDGSDAERNESGRDLMSHGLRVRRTTPLSSELVFVSELKD